MTEIRVPTLGKSVTEATIGRWFKKPGDAVRADEALAELETDKVTLEVNAPASGVLAEILAKEGETVAPGALLGQIAEGASSAAEGKPAAAPPIVDRAAPAAKQPSSAAPSPSPSPPPPPPAAAKIAQEKGIDLSSVAGSGKRGQVLKGDVLGLAAQAAGELRKAWRRQPLWRGRLLPPRIKRARSACECRGCVRPSPGA